MERQTNSAITHSVFTIGHSNHPLEAFLALLSKHDIEVLVDIRSFPFSKFAAHFDQDNLRSAVKRAGKTYMFLGRELGGKPKEPDFYDEEGYVLYWKIAESALFQQGIERVRNGIKSYKVTLLCSEEDPSHCHRRLLVGRVLRQHSVQIQHIRGTGYVQSEHELERITALQDQQMNIFSSVQGQEQPWRSMQSVVRKRPPLSSSSP